MSEMGSYIEFLGTCANQTADQEPVALVLQTGDDRVLVDTGPGIVRQIYRSGRNVCDFDTILVTHCHGDHVAGFPYFIWSYFYEAMQGLTPPDEIRVLGLPDVVAGLEATLRFCYNPDVWPFTVKFEGVEPAGRTELQLKSSTITTVPVDHSVPTIGLRLDCSDGAASYSCDTLYTAEFVDVARDSNLMVHEGFVTDDRKELSVRTRHGTAREAGRAAREADASQLAMVHFFPPYAQDLVPLLVEAREEFAGEVFIPEMFQRVPLQKGEELT